MTDGELHTLIRLRASALGPGACKKMLRFNDIATVARRYEAEGSGLENGLREALDCCVVGHPMHVKTSGPLALLGQFELGPNG